METARVLHEGPIKVSYCPTKPAFELSKVGSFDLAMSLSGAQTSFWASWRFLGTPLGAPQGDLPEYFLGTGILAGLFCFFPHCRKTLGHILCAQTGANPSFFEEVGFINRCPYQLWDSLSSTT